MRAVAMLVGLLAAFGASYAAFAAMRAVGPENRTSDFGFGDAALVSPNGGDLFESENFALVVAALERELGPDGAVSYLSLERSAATATGLLGNAEVNVRIDASGRSQTSVIGKADPGARMPVSKFDPAAIDTIVRESQRESRGLVEGITFQGYNRQWTIEIDGGEPDSFIANLDGAAVRLPDEPNPVGVGAAPDSLLRSENLAKVIAAARKEAPAEARVLGFDIRPDRISLLLDTGERALTLDYGYDAQLTSRALRARMGADTPSLGWDDIDTEAPERMARTAGKLLNYKLADVQYVLVNLSPIPGRKGTLSMYFPNDHEPLYVVADLNGRKLGWPGRER